MKRLLRTHGIYLFAFVAVLGLGGEALGCSRHPAPEQPRSIVNPEMYIFVAEVEGHTKPVVDPANFRGEAIGLKVRVLDAIHVPFNFHYPNIEVFLFRHGPDCFPEARKETQNIRIGTKYWFAIFPATIISKYSRWNDAVRLQTDTFSRYAVLEERFGYSFNSATSFDYRNELELLRKNRSDPENRQWFDDLVYVETSKDLLRLAGATSEADRIKVLERLLYNPTVNYFRLFRSEVGKPLTSEEYPTALLRIMKMPPEKRYPEAREYSQEEKVLLKQRIKLEASGELKLW